MRVSVVLSTYNGARFIAEQMRSLVAQTILPYEVIVNDDGSSDSTVSIIQSFADHLPLKFHQNGRRLGYGSSFLAGVARARGELVAFCDQDDKWMPEKLERCVHEFSNDNVVLAVHATTVVDELGKTTGRRWPDIKDTTLLPRGELRAGQWVGMAMTFRRSIVDGVPPEGRPRALAGHDHWVAHLGSCRGLTSLIADPLAEYRLHDDNACGIFRPATASKVGLVRGAGSELYLEQSHTFAERAEYLFRLAYLWREAEPESAAAARRLAEVQSCLAGGRERRAHLYAATGGLQRLEAFARGVRSGAYRGDGYEELGARALAKDALQVLTGKVARG